MEEINTEQSFEKSLDRAINKGNKIKVGSIFIFGKNRRIILKAMPHLEKVVIGSTPEKVFLRSIYKILESMTETGMLTNESKEMDSKEKFLDGLRGLAQYGDEIDFREISLQAPEKRSLYNAVIILNELAGSGINLSWVRLLNSLMASIVILPSIVNESVIEDNRLSKLYKMWEGL